jgi:hypothetical protein
MPPVTPVLASPSKTALPVPTRPSAHSSRPCGWPACSPSQWQPWHSFNDAAATHRTRRDRRQLTRFECAPGLAGPHTIRGAIGRITYDVLAHFSCRCADVATPRCDPVLGGSSDTRALRGIEVVGIEGSAPFEFTWRRARSCPSLELSLAVAHVHTHPSGWDVDLNALVGDGLPSLPRWRVPNHFRPWASWASRRLEPPDDNDGRHSGTRSEQGPHAGAGHRRHESHDAGARSTAAPIPRTNVRICR